MAVRAGTPGLAPKSSALLKQHWEARKAINNTRLTMDPFRRLDARVTGQMRRTRETSIGLQPLSPAPRPRTLMEEVGAKRGREPSPSPEVFAEMSFFSDMSISDDDRHEPVVATVRPGAHGGEPLLTAHQLAQQARVYQPCVQPPLQPAAEPLAQLPPLAPFDERLALHNFINTAFFLQPHIPVSARPPRTSEAHAPKAATAAKPAATCRKCGHIKEAWPSQHGPRSGRRGVEAGCNLAGDSSDKGFVFDSLGAADQKRLRGQCYFRCATCIAYLGPGAS